MGELKLRKRQKYQRSRAITSPWSLEGCSGRDFHAVVVVPALAEMTSLPKNLASLALNPPQLLAKTLIVVVVNQRQDTSVEQKCDNRQTLDWLRATTFPFNLCWVDATGSGLEFGPKDGVGRARKIGFDLALERLNWAGDPLCISLDADTLVDGHYLAAIFSHFRQHPQPGAYLPFRHQQADDRAMEAATRLYELYLRSYRHGLCWAGSPYAFSAIGSAMACRAEAYVAAGGMKQRQAGEDFYFLQQLAKIGGVAPLTGTCVHPAPRYSRRVPFGTGRAIEAVVEDGRQLFRFVSLTSFRILRDWLACVEQNLEQDHVFLEERAALISPLLHASLEKAAFAEYWQKLQQQHRVPQRGLAWQQWFDGLRTRQLLIQLEGEGPQVDPATLVAELLTETGFPGFHDMATQLRQLEIMQGIIDA